MQSCDAPFYPQLIGGEQDASSSLMHHSLRPWCRFIKLCAIILSALLFLTIVSLHLTQRTRTMQIKCAPHSDEPIDVVYTWVNGSDEHFQRTLQQYSSLEKTANESSSAHRFSDKDELKYSLRSLEKHMPWLGHVYIVTNGQIPHWLNLDHPRITLITHEEIFKDISHLPTFSSPAIESNLHRIPNLSRRFIYFNDDIFLNADVYPEDFFTASEGFRTYAAWYMPDCARSCHWPMLANGKCDPECYNEACDFDLTDCDHITAQLQRELQQSNAIQPEASFLPTSDINALPGEVQAYNAQKVRMRKQLKRAQLKLTMRETLKRHLSNDSSNASSRDLFTASLLHTQKVLSAHFSDYSARRVIAHAPIMFDTHIMQRLQTDFDEEFRNTQRHRFRHESNLQIEFLYSHYLHLASITKSMDEIFDEFDTDGSSTWSDREIRTLLARMHSLPLTFEMLSQFESMLINCTHDATHFETATLSYERYVDSTLPTIDKATIRQCRELERRLAQDANISKRHLYKTVEVMAAQSASFNMLRSNMAAATLMMDQNRKHPRKFVCINDDLDYSNSSRHDNEFIAAVLADFFLSLFPHPSQFELQPTLRNRFAHVSELRHWQGGWTRYFNSFIHSLLMWLTYFVVCVVLLWLFCLRRRRRHFNVLLR